jgi:hypothetical protein
MTHISQEISKRVEQYLIDEEEVEGQSWEELVAILDDAIKTAASAELYALRARMFIAAYEPYSAMRDWEQAVALAPHDRDAQLALAGLRLKRPDSMAESTVRHEKFVAQGGVPATQDDEDGEQEEEDEYEDEEEEDDWDEADEERAAMLAQRYTDEGTQALLALFDAHVNDLVFVHQLFEALDELYTFDTWSHYTLLLKALAAHPNDIALRKREARFLVALASHCAVDSEATPAGFWESVSGQRLHVVTLERAVRCIDAVCALAPDGALVVAKADLLAALEHYPAAVAAYEQAATMLDGAAATADDEQAEELSETADEARAQAALCQQGRAAINQANFASIESAVAQMADMRAAMGMEPATDDHGMNASLAELRGALESATLAMTDDQRTEYARLAESVARQTVGTIELDPIELHPIATSGLEGGLLPWFDSIRPDLEQSGLRLGAQFDNPANNRMLGAQCQGQWWTDAGGASALVVEAVNAFSLKRLVTELSDRRFIITADDRGRSFWEQGPGTDLVSVDGDTPIGTMVGLHLARVARVLAANPALHAVPIDSLARLAETENRKRIAKYEFRMREGVTELEVRGMHVQFHDEFKALLDAQLREKMASLPRPVV